MGRVSFSPKQPGTGLPSPTNIRPIYPGLTIDGIGDIYGGYLDVYNAEIVETDAYAVLDDASKWYDFSTRAFGYDYSFSDRETGSNSNLLVTIAPSGNPSSDPRDWWARWDSTSGYIAVVRWTDGFDAPTMDEIKALSTAGNIAISYPLATPIHHSLTTAQLRQAMQQLGVVSQSVASSRHIIMNAPHVETPTPAGLLTFDTDMAAPLKSCRVSFRPKQLGSGEPSPSNVQPITGFTGIDFCRSSENLFSSEGARVGRYRYTGTTIVYEDTGAAANYLTTDYLPINTSAEYHVYIQNTELHATPRVTALRITNSKEIASVAISQIQQFEDGPYCVYTLTTASATPYYVLSYRISETNIVVSHDVSVTPVDWTTEAGTVYGGYVDLVNGVVVATHALTTPNGNSWSVAGNNTFQAGHLAAQSGDDSEFYEQNMLCSHNKWDASRYVHVNGSGQLMANKAFWTSAGLSTVSESTIAAYCTDQANNGTPIQVCYPLLTPITYQLTPTILKTLRGANHIWSSANGNVELSYWKH